MTWWQVKRRAPGWPRRRVLFWWTIVAGAIRLVGRLLYGARMRGTERIPRTGPVLYVANHQSHLDPPLVGSFVDGVGTFRCDDTWDGRPIVVRFLWSTGPEAPRWEQAFSADGGQSWETNWVMDFERVAG